jgi:diguanylate cyclase (GGDEF)-like protein
MQFKSMVGLSKVNSALRLKPASFLRLRAGMAFVILMVAALVIPVAPVYAGEPSSADHQSQSQDQLGQVLTSLRFRHIDVSTGLPDNHVETILQDHAGFIWIGTWGGLVRYDGYHFLVFKNNPDDPNSLSNDNISQLLETSDGKIWVATRSGMLNRFDPATQQFTRYKLSASSLVQDRQGTLWAATASGQFGRLDPQTGVFQPQTLTNCLNTGPQAMFRKMGIDPQTGALWLVGTALFRFDPATGQSNCYNPPTPPRSMANPAPNSGDLINAVPVPGNGPEPASTGVRFTDVSTSQPGYLWLAGNVGLFKFDKATGTFTVFRLDKNAPGPAQPVSDRPTALNVVSLYLDKEGVLWLGADGTDGIYKFDLKTEKIIAHYSTDPANADSYAAGPTWAIMEDREGLLWFGSVITGINILDRRQTQFTYYRRDPLSDNSFPRTPIQALYQEPGGKIWMGSNSEIASFNPQDGTFQHFLTYAGPLPATRPEAVAISAFFPDDQNGLWFDGVDGLYRFDRQTQQTQVYRAPEMLQNVGQGIEIDSIAQDSRKNFWVLSKNFLYYFETAKLRFTERIPVRAPDATGVLKPVIARIVLLDRQGEVWVGGIGFLGRLDRQTGQFKGYFSDPNNPESMPNLTPSQLYEDSRGYIWIPSSGGLIQFNSSTESFKLYTEKEGLPANTLFGMLEDENGNFWISSTRGLSKFNPTSGVIRNYDTSDGLQGNQFNGYSYFKNSQGKMFFGGENGLTAFFPSQIVENPYNPPVVLTGMELFNRPVVPGANSILNEPIWSAGSVTLDHNQNFVSFEIAVLSYAAPQNNRFRYRLEGLETDWKETDSSTRSVNYANLQPGEYTFRVQGSNAAGVWSDRQVALKIVINPPWWDSWLFRVPVALLVIGLLVFGLRWWSQRIERRNRLLEALIEERTKELAQAKERAEAANLELQRLAVLDELTQIANRRRFDQYLLAQWEYGKQAPVSLLLCDVDFFKHFNDNHGHQAGDNCLYQVAQAIMRSVGYTKDLVARFGGEEFAVILPETGTTGAWQVARTIQLELKRLCILHGFSDTDELVTLSIGVATITPTHDNSATTREEPKILIAAADAALYQAKEQGRNRVVISPTMSTRLEGEIAYS